VSIIEKVSGENVQEIEKNLHYRRLNFIRFITPVQLVFKKKIFV